MHDTAMMNSKHFFDAYGANFGGAQQKVKVIEIGSQDVNGSLRATCPAGFEYVGVDFVAGKGVDVILDDPYTLPFETESADIVLSSSVFEHSQMFWLLFNEILRILKPRGLFYLNAPSNGDFHRWPVDCWRFYPDSGGALVTWARRSGMKPALLESYTSTQIGDNWNDFVAVFVKDDEFAGDFKGRILDSKRDINNGVLLGSADFINPSVAPEDRRKIQAISQITTNKIKV
jgi:SAM-dependent methyltransferase